MWCATRQGIMEKWGCTPASIIAARAGTCARAGPHPDGHSMLSRSRSTLRAHSQERLGADTVFRRAPPWRQPSTAQMRKMGPSRCGTRPTPNEAQNRPAVARLRSKLDEVWGALGELWPQLGADRCLFRDVCWATRRSHSLQHWLARAQCADIAAGTEHTPRSHFVSTCGRRQLCGVVARGSDEGGRKNGAPTPKVAGQDSVAGVGFTRLGCGRRSAQCARAGICSPGAVRLPVCSPES